MRCLSCQYDLKNLPEKRCPECGHALEQRCPECGRAFEARNPRTFQPEIRSGIRIPGWVAIVGLIALFFLLMFILSVVP